MNKSEIRAKKTNDRHRYVLVDKLIKTSRTMLLRGHVLRIAYEARPGGIDTEIVRAALKRIGYGAESREILAECGYMENKGLLKIQNVSNDEYKTDYKLVHITSGGIDLLEGTVPHIDGIETGS